MAVKVRIKGLNEVQNSVTKRLNKVIKDNRIYVDAHKLLEDEIRSNRNPATQGPYDPLANSTIDRRRYLSKHNTPHSRYKLRKPNLTLTGKLLEGLFSRFNTRTGVLTIDIKGLHPGYKGASGQIKGSRKPRKKIVEKLNEIGRPIFEVSDGFLELLAERIEKALRRL